MIFLAIVRAIIIIIYDILEFILFLAHFNIIFKSLFQILIDVQCVSLPIWSFIYHFPLTPDTIYHIFEGIFFNEI